ncbi:CCA tRNA nucleotidyltransferase [Brevibacillus ruminantium]|uniref:CCA tRNA nucleotidyltransferase n=1 Tax=Brevibacillus ruminantium TaxID=2950604 RepID=A0ABY4W9M7_9BACL|nr:CCA tRNA nucleotidyltransferase [Brevibacillus ruminantium]USG63479.1 CCA tRNA nucleotidyltransferase [Brevibacillus ruminantium]
MGKSLAENILKTLEESGYEAYFVGGCVRDWLLNRPVHDIDICTNAHPGDVMRLFPQHVPTGLKHGTVSVKEGGSLFEVTTYRTEGEYEDFRRPKEVNFVSELQLDLERRDFTMNAMAMDRYGVLVDPFHGLSDLKNGLIRAVGHPEQRFREDALRILRAVRFAAQLNFRIEEKTLAAMKGTAELLQHIAIERIREELQKMLESPAPAVGTALIVETAALQAWPRLQTLFAKAKGQSDRLAALPNLPHKWALLMYAAGFLYEEARQACLELKLSKRDKELICALVQTLADIHPKWDVPQNIDWQSHLLERGWQFCTELNALLQACWKNKPDRDIANALMQIYEQMPVKSVQELALNGHDLYTQLSKKPGQWVHDLLQHLWEQTAFYQLPNTPEALLEEARKEVARHEH